MNLKINEENRFKYLESLSNTLNSIMASDDDIGDKEAELSRALSILLSNDTGNVEINVHIVSKKKTDEKFFGVRIFPKAELFINLMKNLAVDRQSATTFVKEWSKCNSWFIELDYQLFDKIYTNFNSQEIISLILFEIDRIMTSTSVSSLIHKCYKTSLDDLSIQDQMDLKPLSPLYTVGASTACSEKNWYNDDDMIVVYGNLVKNFNLDDNLMSIVNKIVDTYGTIHNSEFEINAKVLGDFVWCNKIINSTVIRSKTLKDQLYYKATLRHSMYMKTLFAYLLETFRVKMRERYTGVVTECVNVDIYNRKTTEKYIPIIENTMANLIDNPVRSEIAIEAMFGFRKGSKMPSQYDIDRIIIEVDKITNQHDRLFVLDLVYDLYDSLDAFRRSKEYKSKQSYYDAQIEEYKKQLNEVRSMVMDKKIQAKKYKFFVQYPEGYEG